MTSIAIGNSIKEIGRYAFHDCSGLTEIRVEATTPPTVYENTFDYVKKSIPLYVPVGCEEAYHSADYWSEFTNIKVAPTFDVGTVLVVNGIYYDVKSPKEVAVRYPTYSEDDVEYAGTIRIPEKFILCGITYSVTSIGSSAFSGCTGLTSVTIPNSVTSIGSSAFGSCSGLTSVTIPNSVTSIGDHPFSHCTGLTKIRVEDGNETYDSRENCNAIVKTATNTLIAGCKNSFIPNSVTSIGDKAFNGCAGLTEITIPESVTSIGEHAFGACTGLTSITIPNSVTSIGQGAFSGCI